MTEDGVTKDLGLDAHSVMPRETIPRSNYE